MKAKNKDKEKLELLIKLGIPGRESRILIVLDQSNGGLKQKDICMQTYMYQPEISISLKSMKDKGWVTIVKRIPAKNKGRPYAIYALKKPLILIVEEIEESITKKYEHTIKDIERLKKIVSSKDLYNSKSKKV